MQIHCGTLLFVLCACLAGQPGAPVVRNLAVTITGEGEEQTIHIRNEYLSVIKTSLPNGINNLPCQS